MKKWAKWTFSGFGLAMAGGFMGLAHLSATIATLTVFCATPTLIVLGLDTWLAPKERWG